MRRRNTEPLPVFPFVSQLPPKRCRRRNLLCPPPVSVHHSFKNRLCHHVSRFRIPISRNHSVSGRAITVVQRIHHMKRDGRPLQVTRSEWADSPHSFPRLPPTTTFFTHNPPGIRVSAGRRISVKMSPLQAGDKAGHNRGSSTAKVLIRWETASNRLRRAQC